MHLSPFHLTYCLNIYAGETWQETFSAIKSHCPEVKQKTSPHRPFGLGLRLSAQACQQLTNQPELLEEFRQWLQKNEFYVFTINIFPYGQFHQRVVKKDVYYPDWSDEKRLVYTLQAIDILASILPAGVDGSLSTVPVTYGKDLSAKALANLITCGEYLKKLAISGGKKIVLALEPEPDCYLETTQETINFFTQLYSKNPSLKPYLGICFDTCHIALQFEDLNESLLALREAEILIAKVQLSSVLALDAQNINPQELLLPFVEKTYLHQTKVKENNKIYSFADLPEALKSSHQGEWRVHFHLPLYLTKTSLGVETTNSLLNRDFFNLLIKVCDHLEIETYTFDVFPECHYSIDESVIREIDFIKKKLADNLIEIR